MLTLPSALKSLSNRPMAIDSPASAERRVPAAVPVYGSGAIPMPAGSNAVGTPSALL